MEQPYIKLTKKVITLVYNPAYGDDRICTCSHKYYRHFDSYDHNCAVGCKYCECFTFKEMPNQRKMNYETT